MWLCAHFTWYRNLRSLSNDFLRHWKLVWKNFATKNNFFLVWMSWELTYKMDPPIPRFTYPLRSLHLSSPQKKEKKKLTHSTVAHFLTNFLSLLAEKTWTCTKATLEAERMWNMLKVVNKDIRVASLVSFYIPWKYWEIFDDSVKPCDVSLVSLLLTLNIFHNFSSVSIVNFEQVNISWVFILHWLFEIFMSSIIFITFIEIILRLKHSTASVTLNL